MPTRSHRALARSISSLCGCAALTGLFLSATPAFADERAFQRLDQAIRTSPALHPIHDTPHPRPGQYTPDRYVIGTGQGDLAKGRLACQRVAELAARADLAKQIRVLIKEHAVDRTRERLGHPLEQDLEITREEIVQEYLHGVTIVERHADETTGLCHSTAVMPRESLVAPSSGSPTTTTTTPAAPSPANHTPSSSAPSR